MEANRKIYVDSEGVIKVILVPEEPLPNLILTTKKCSKLWEDFFEALSKAKQEAIPFKDQAKTIASVEFNSNNGVIHCKPNTIYNVPEGYSVEVERKCQYAEEDCGCADCFKQNLCAKYAILKKTESSAPSNTEGVSTEKERLRKEFNHQFRSLTDFQRETIFDFFWKEIEEGNIIRDMFMDNTEKLQQEISSLRQATGNLLAILHGDGGHYQEKCGTEKAIIDAAQLIHTKWFTTGVLHDINQLSKENESLRQALEAADEVIKHVSPPLVYNCSAKDFHAALDNYNKLKQQ